jgi:hypothetical protein
MARDLNFWKTSKKTEDNNAVYIALSNEEYLEYIDELPKNEIQEDFDKTFNGWEKLDDVHYEKGKEAFELMITNQLVRVDCYGLSEISMNKIIDIMLKYGCPLYDPAIDVRFDD